MAKHAKAHFDYTGDVIDGAKERWRILLLLDAIVCHARKQLDCSESDSGGGCIVKEIEGKGETKAFEYHSEKQEDKDFKEEDSQEERHDEEKFIRRRKRQRMHCRNFDQHHALKQSVFAAYNQAQPSLNTNEVIDIKEIDYPWTSLQILKETLLRGDKKKSHERRKQVLERLISCETIQCENIKTTLLNCVRGICRSEEKIPLILIECKEPIRPDGSEKPDTFDISPYSENDYENLDFSFLFGDHDDDSESTDSGKTCSKTTKKSRFLP